MRLARYLTAFIKLALVYFAARGVLTLFDVQSPWLPLVIAVTALAVGRIFVVRAFLRGVRQLVLTKSDVLRNAGVTVHEVLPVPTPAGFVPSAEATPLFYRIDVTIEPRAADAVWDADDVVLVDAIAAPPVRNPAHFESRHVTAYAHDVEVYDGRSFAGPQSAKLRGQQRVRFTMAVEKRSPRVRLKYYFEHLEPAFDLPPHQITAAA